MDFGDERQQNEFNMGISYLNRLNALFYTADNAAMDLDSHSWFHALITLFRELSTEMKEKEIEIYNKKVQELNTKVGEESRINNKMGRHEISPEIYMELHTFEMFLRKILKGSGLQMKTSKDPRKAMA